jgi:peroxiredoxin family protein
MTLDTSERMSLVVFSGTADKLTAVATLAAGAAAMGLDVDLFLTFWGLEAFKKGASTDGSVPLVSAEYVELGPMMRDVMQAKHVPSWLETLHAAREIGNLKVYACSATMELFGHKLEDMEDIVDEVTGAASFIDRARDGKLTLFI